MEEKEESKKKRKKKIVCWCCGRTPKEAKKIIKVSIGGKRVRLCKECRWYLGEYLNPLSTLNYLKKRGYKNLNLENFGKWKDKFPELNPKPKLIDRNSFLFKDLNSKKVEKSETELKKRMKIGELT